jgi:hypothetical protein
MIGFETMIFDLNEGLHHSGLLSRDKYITDFIFIKKMVIATILTYAFMDMVLSHKHYFALFEKSIFYQIAIYIILLIGSMYYFKEYGALLLITTFIVATLVVGTRQEFKGVRHFLNKHFGWMF